ncbi:enoyl-CoA hydratase-related protein [Novosphingobium sp. PS1R-30]|uniref:Enoyl-CoA hydratase-related protein n=1 Tax=Novosphingobium anseongense TaxID=3133436 RepID=A0ABU8S2S8_9SPHN
MKEARILLRREGAVAVMTINRPGAGNTIDRPLTAELEVIASAIAQDSAVRCVVLTGAGKLFCGGGDIAAMAAAADCSAYLQGLADALHRSVEVLSSMSKPLLVLVNGPAAGAGLSLAILGDLVLASRSAHFTAAYGSVGLTPDGGMSWLLPRLVGLRRAQEMILGNRRVSAEEGAAIGLVTRVVDDHDLLAEGMALARQLAEGPTLALGMARSLLREGQGVSLNHQLAREARTIASAAALPDAREGVAAFLDRRPAQFSGETR